MSLRVSPSLTRMSIAPVPCPLKSREDGSISVSSFCPPRTMPTMRPASISRETRTATGLRRRQVRAERGS